MASQTTVLEANRELKFREHARQLGEKWATSTASHIVYDLAKVTHISRSFADELYKQQQYLANAGKKLELLNANAHISKMLDIVSKTQHSPERKTSDLQPMRFETVEEFTRFLATF